MSLVAANRSSTAKATLPAWASVIALLAAALGPGPQIFSAFGLVWGAVLALLSVSLLQYVAVPDSVKVPIFLLFVPLAIALAHSGFRFPAPHSIPVLVTLLTFPVALLAGVSTGYNGSPKRLRQIDKALTVMALALPIGLIAKIALFGTDGRELSSRPFGQGCALVFLWIVSRAPTPIAGLRSPLALFTVLGMALSLSRTAFLVAIVGFVVLLLTSYPKQPMRIIRIVALLAIGITVFYLLILNVDIVRQRFSGNADGVAITLSSRENVWPGVASAITERPFFGEGAGESARFVEVLTDGKNANPHNDFLRLGFDVGLIGLGTFLIAVYLLWRRLRRADTGSRLVRSGLATLASIPVLMSFTNGLTYLGISVPMFMLVGLAIGHTVSVENEPPAEFPWEDDDLDDEDIQDDDLDDEDIQDDDLDDEDIQDDDPDGASAQDDLPAIEPVRISR